MWKTYCVSVYHQQYTDWTKIENYLRNASSYGCKEVFTSAHMPEEKMHSQLEFVQRLLHLAHQYGLALTVDFGGASLHYLLNNAEHYTDFNIDYVRMDYGYDASIMEEMEARLGITGFVWNASTIDDEVLDSFLKIAKKHPNYQIRACHNFYPRKETALDKDFVMMQNKKFHEYQIPVTTCVPNLKNGRPPLYEGLPTIEHHRSVSFEEAVLDCVEEGLADDLLIGDLWLDEAQFQFLYRVMKEKKLDLNVTVTKCITEDEKNIIFGYEHHIRYDSNRLVLRSQSSREMAEYAKEIEPGHQTERKRGSITIDNRSYGRYSGELQMILTDLEADHRVNVVAYIDEKDMFKLNYYRDGFKYVLKEKKHE